LIDHDHAITTTRSHHTEGINDMTIRQPHWRSTDEPRPYNAAEAAILAGMEWEPELLPLPVPAGDRDREQLRETRGMSGIQVDHSIFVDISREYNLMLRDDTGELLSVAKSSYFPLYNSQVNEIADRLVARYGFVWGGITAFNGGRTVIYTLWYPEGTWTVTGDHSKQEPFINLINSHDGSTAFHVVPSAFRPSCANVINTLKLRARAQKLGLSIRHTRQITNMDAITEEVFNLVERGLGQLQELRDVSEAMAVAKPINIATFVAEWLPMPPSLETTDADLLASWTRRANMVSAKRRLFNDALNSDTQAGDVRSPYALWQAAIEVDQHEYSVRGFGSRAKRNLMGGSLYSDRALDVASRMAGILI
jgi:hypothetical protein